MSRTTDRSSLARSPGKYLLPSLLCLALCAPLAAGVTFTDIAADPATGISYQRFPTPSRVAAEEVLYSMLLPLPAPFPAAYPSMSPEKPRGTPGVAIFDYDNDGALDIYVTNGPGHANSLYQNQLVRTGELRFVDVAAAAGVAATAQDGSGACFGDLDNDGFDDLYVTGIGEPNLLFRNNGNGTFSDLTASAGVGAGSFHHSACAMGDFNGDGYLDLVVGNTYDNWLHRRPMFVNPPYPGMEHNQLFLRNPAQPGIKFVDASATSGIRNLAGITTPSVTFALAAVDYDQDGDTDIIFADSQGTILFTSPSDMHGYIRIFRNDGTGHFTDVTMTAGGPLGPWHGLSLGDYNCDGNVDLFATSYGFWFGGPHNHSRWLLGNGSGGFTDPDVGALKATSYGWGTATIDYDNDGDQDIFFYGDDDAFTVIMMVNPGSVLENQGCSASFVQRLDVLTTDHRFREVHGAAAGDLNNDGFLDMVTAANFQIQPLPGRMARFPLPGFTPPGSVLDNLASVLAVEGRSGSALIALSPRSPLPNGNLAVEINSGDNGNGSVAFVLAGTAGQLAGGKSNRDGLGATVRFTPDGGSPELVPVVGGASYASQSSRIAHFGLGTAAKGTVEVLWPGGTRNRLYDVAAGERVLLPEIPCSFDGAFKNFGQYNSCVRTSLNKLVQQGTIGHAERERLIDSAVRAFNKR